ncbi:MAG: hypothetical protein ACYCXA_02615 [Actinomycetes bacterium]
MPLRPLGVSEILDGAFTAIRAHPKVMLGSAAAVTAVAELIRVAATWGSLSRLSTQIQDLGASGAPPTSAALGSYTSALALTFLPTTLISLLAQVLLTGLLTIVVSKAVLGRRVSAADAWHDLRGRIPALLGVLLLVLLATLAPFVVAVGLGLLVAAGTGAAGGVVVGVLVGLAAAVAAVYLWVALSMAAATTVLEKRSVMASLRRSRRLVAGSWWRVLGLLLLIGIITALVSGVATIPFTVASTIAQHGSAVPTALVPVTISALGAVIAGTIAYPFQAAAIVLVYIDLRIRREALDLTLIAAAQQADTASPASWDPRTGTGRTP